MRTRSLAVVVSLVMMTGCGNDDKGAIQAGRDACVVASTWDDVIAALEGGRSDEEFATALVAAGKSCGGLVADWLPPNGRQSDGDSCLALRRNPVVQMNWDGADEFRSEYLMAGCVQLCGPLDGAGQTESEEPTEPCAS